MTITGPPGIGKSRLAAAVAAAMKSEMEDAGEVWTCDTSAARGLEDICRAVASTLGAPLGPDPVAHVGHVLACQGPSLVVLDDFEHLVEHGSATIARWIRAAPEVRFLVTSRETLRLEDEWVHELGPLSLPEDVEETWDSDAGKLFSARMRKWHAADTPDPETKALVFEIVRRLEGIPLALELAAAQCARLGAAHIRERLGRSLDALVSVRRDAPERHATLRAAVELSFRLLAPVERDVLAQAVVFRGGFSLEAAAAILDTSAHPGAPSVDALLASLCDKSLLVSRPAAAPRGEVRFTWYETICELAREQLDPAKRSQAEARHAAWFLARGEALALRMDGPEGAEACRALALETDNLLAVHAGALAKNPPCAESALRAALVLDAVLAWKGPARMLANLLGAALEVASGEVDRLLRARALEARARTRRLLGLPGEARADLLAALALLDESDEATRLAATITRHLGLLALDGGQPAAARDHFEKSLALSRQVGAAGIEGRTFVFLGTTATLEGRVSEAEDHYERACSLLRAARDRRWLGISLAHLENLHAQTGRGDPRPLHAEVLAIARVFDSRQMAGQAETSLGSWLHRNGDLRRARGHYEASLDILRKLGDRRLEALILGNLATLHHEEGELGRARDLYEEALPILEGAGLRHAEATFLAMLGGVYGSLGLVERARTTLDEAARHPVACEDPLTREFIELERAFLDLALAGRVGEEGDVDAAVLARQAAERRIAAAEGRSGGNEVRPSLVERWSDAFLAVRILRRRLDAAPALVARPDRVVLDARAHEMRFAGRTISLGRRPVLRELLYALADVIDSVVPKEALCARVFGDAYDPFRHDNPLRVNLNRLRAVVEPAGLRVDFIAGGYRLSAPEGFLYLRS